MTELIELIGLTGTVKVVILGCLIVLPYILFIDICLTISRMNKRLDEISETLLALTNDRRWRDVQDGKELRPKDADK